jgi:hypothetical protein
MAAHVLIDQLLQIHPCAAQAAYHHIGTNAAQHRQITAGKGDLLVARVVQQRASNLCVRGDKQLPRMARLIGWSAGRC